MRRTEILSALGTAAVAAVVFFFLVIGLVNFLPVIQSMPVRSGVVMVVISVVAISLLIGGAVRRIWRARETWHDIGT